mgnify:CR=1 FL=1
MTDHTFEIGSNWVKSPHRILADIEREFDLTADGYEARSAEWDYRGATDGPAFAARHLPCPARVLDAGCGTGLVGAGLQALQRRSLPGIGSVLGIRDEKADPCGDDGVARFGVRLHFVRIDQRHHASRRRHDFARRRLIASVSGKRRRMRCVHTAEFGQPTAVRQVLFTRGAGIGPRHGLRFPAFATPVKPH